MTVEEHPETVSLSRSMRTRQPSRRWTSRGIVLAASVFLSVLWIASYPEVDLDDKAVHYYSAARLYADHAHVEAVESARTAWRSRLHGSSRPTSGRIDNRLSSYANYLIPSTLVRLVAGIDRSSPGSPPRSFTRPVKLAFLIAFVLGLSWIVGVTWRSPLTAVLVLAGLLLAEFLASPAWLAQRSRYNMRSLVYVPRGSAVVLLAGTFAAFHGRRWWAVVVGLVLVFLWHLGFAAVMVPVALVAFGLGCAARVRSWRARLVLVGLLLVFGGITSLGAASVRHLMRLWVPLLFFCGLSIASRPPRSPAATGAALAAVFLFLTQSLIVALGHPGVVDWFAERTGSALVGELPMRLSGARHLAAFVLLLTVGVGIADVIARDRGISPAWCRRVMPAAAAVLLVVLFCLRIDEVRDVASGRCPFFVSEDAQVPRVTLAPENLHTLDPTDEASFFASLGDFLLRALPEPGANPQAAP